MGSQSVASTIDTIWGLRTAKLVLGSAAFLLWGLSPLGGQSALRLVSTAPGYVDTASELRYINDMQKSELVDSNWIRSRSGANALYTASLLSPSAIRNSERDVWGNLKIPRLEAVEGNASQSPIQVQYSDQIVYSSLLGIPVMGLRMDENATFTMNTGYFALQCKPMVLRDIYSNPEDFFSPLQFRFPNGSWKHGSEAQMLEDGSYHGAASWLLDTYTPLTSENASLLSNDTPLGRSYGPSSPATPLFFPNLTFASPSDNFWVTTNCSMSYIRVEANASCVGLSCRIVSMRQIPLNDSASGILMAWDSRQESFDYIAFKEMCYNFPLATGLIQKTPGNVVPIVATATERYLNGNEHPFPGIRGVGDASYVVDLSKVPLDDFTKRFSTLFNTYWQSTLLTGYRTNNVSLGDANEDALYLQESFPCQNV